MDTTYCRRVIQTDSQITLHNAPAQGWDDDPAFETHGYYCYLGTPIELQSKPYGTVCFYGDTPREEPFTTDEKLFAELVTHLIERELERAEFEANITDKTNLAATLARVLRHNIRNSLTIVRGYAQELEKQVDSGEHLEIVLREVDDLLGLSEQARQLEQILTKDDQPDQENIVQVVEKIAEDAGNTHPEATISVDGPDEVEAPIRPTFETAIEEVLENAIQHSGESPTIYIEIERVENSIEIRIQDNGPGLPEMEQTALETEDQTPLTHGIGLGLWMVNWIISRHNGNVEATVTDDGTTVTTTLPEVPETGGQTGEREITHARDQYRGAFDEASDGLVIFNDEARIADVNPAAATIYGKDRDELIGRALEDFLPDDYDFEVAWKRFQATTDDDEPELEDDVTELVGDDGQRSVVEYSVVTNIVPRQHLFILQPLISGESRIYMKGYSTKRINLPD